MNITIYRGTHEIGGTLIELKTQKCRILFDSGYPLFLNGVTIDDGVASLHYNELLRLGVLPKINGLYKWDNPSFDAVVISHAHIDHYGLLKYVHSDIPVYLSQGTKKLIEITKLFKICSDFTINSVVFKMYEGFSIKDVYIKPYLMDHSAFDAAAFEISAEGKTVIYSGDFRGHGRKAICLDRFINNATKQADVLLTEGTMLGRQAEAVLSEEELEELLIGEFEGHNSPILFQSSSQNIDRIVTFYKAATRLGKTFVIDVYTANVLYELRQLGNQLPYPAEEYKNIKVFYPYRTTQLIFDYIDAKYAKRFSAFHMPKEKLRDNQNNVVMMVRPSMQRDIELSYLHDGLFIYSMWQGYRNSEYQQKFERYLSEAGFVEKMIHTSGHASISDIKKTILGLDPKKLVPIHTMVPSSFEELSDRVSIAKDGVAFEV